MIVAGVCRRSLLPPYWSKTWFPPALQPLMAPRHSPNLHQLDGRDGPLPFRWDDFWPVSIASAMSKITTRASSNRSPVSL